jgi:energy-coupling factor transport system ATP-binding protein
MLQIKNLSFRYNNESNWLFQNFNFEVNKGKIVAIKGDSGSGKTTLLNIICGVIPKMIKGEFTGKVFFDNRSLDTLTLPQTAPFISLLMQEPDNQLFFPLVEQELAFGPENLKISPTEIQQRIDKTLNELQIENLRNKETHNLSFGQKKLVTFASLLTLDPQVFLMDELTAGLSPEYIANIKRILKNLAAKGKTIFLTDHAGDFADISDTVIKLNFTQIDGKI